MNLSPADRNKLLALARRSIELGLELQKWVMMPEMSLPVTLLERRGSFVTLRIGNQLRGCCGNLAANCSLAEDMWRNAQASAFSDPRFSPLERDELPDVRIHISVLSPLESIAVKDEAELIARLRPNIDGVVLERGGSRATFLPDVWEDLPHPEDFLRHLKQKAGWPEHSWASEIKVQRYTTESFGERDSTEFSQRNPLRA